MGTNEQMGVCEMSTERFVERLGRTAEVRAGRRGYVVVEVELRTNQGEYVTTEHGMITDPLELSVQASQYAPYDRKDNPSSSGQAREALAEVTEPAPGWTLEEIAELRAIWERWHLNTMRAACAHMPADARARWDRREAVVCDAGSGYKYGTSWLVEPIPAKVVERVRHLMRDRSADLYRSRGYDASGKPIQEG
jgi:hypothetical protein